MHQRRHRTRLPRRVDHQHDRRIKLPGNGRGRRFVGAATTVEKTHHALDHRDIGRHRSARAVYEQRHDPMLTNQKGIEVAAGSSGGQGVIGRIDVIRTDFVRRHRMSTGSEGCHQSGGDRCFTGPGGGRGNDEPGNGHHSIPR